MARLTTFARQVVEDNTFKEMLALCNPATESLLCGREKNKISKLSLKQLCDFLEPVHEATELISTNQHVSLVFVGPIYISLIERLHEACKIYEAQELIPEAEKKLMKLMHYFDQALLKPSHHICEAFKEEANQFIVNSNYSIQSNDPTKLSRNTIKDGLFKKKKRKPIQYWKSHSSQYSTLANKSRNLLVVPPSSAPCKQVFSARQYIQNYTCNWLTLETFIFSAHVIPLVNQ
ncbi:uncharacterized protein VP01_107g6 [Puccinia sorghi]|uniref:HAT C-terminal dimerisation domain-containing protein n=1 Tax=Puccinia sorghi TaxID=27349 RepID=A0A0L6VTN4_9BASI|nr:uncharacterized protein VP01_107g6 [Puccinia sorghi]